MEKAVVCYSGGHSSALVAIETVRKYGKNNVILLNHDISPNVEHNDIKRFKDDVSNYLDTPISYANMPDWETMTPLKVSVGIGGFQFQAGNAICTYELKTKPFYKWLAENYPADPENISNEIIIMYGFDKSEPNRITRRSGLLATKGYKTGFPLAFDERTIDNVEEIGIERPKTYQLWKHANCQGCLKAGKQHWYCVFCLRPDLWEEAKEAEKEIGHSIIKGVFLEELEPKFTEMRDSKGICPNEKGNPSSFWAHVDSVLPEQISLIPCECSL